MSGPLVVAVLSTGRCGTQWLASGLAGVYPEIAVAHEPIGPLYRPRNYFRRYDDPEAILEVRAVADRLEAIERAERPYIETGWPLFPALPLMVRRLGARLRIVHLTRHPVPTAASHTVHKTYAGSPRDDAYTRLATLGPEDRDVFAPEYAVFWDHLTPYEKCLYWWTEVHQFALELPRRLPAARLLRVRSEALLAGDRQTLQRLLTFMELPWNEGWLELTGRMIDRWHHQTDEEIEPLQIHRHRRTVEIAYALGYDMAGVDVARLDTRYRGTPNPGLDRIGRFDAAAQG